MNVIVFDKDNAQIDYQFMARSVSTGELIIGWIVVEQPWYTSSRHWTYYIYHNNQISEVEYNKENGWATSLVDKYDIFDKLPSSNTIAVINPEDEIPYYLWSK